MRCSGAADSNSDSKAEFLDKNKDEVEFEQFCQKSWEIWKQFLKIEKITIKLF